jgi:endonuclease VIII
VPEGDTVARTAAVLRRWLVGGAVRVARATPGPLLRRAPDLSGLVGMTVTAVESRGKHLLIAFEDGRHRLTLRSHLGMTGSWHRYRPGEAWRLPARRATLELTTDTAVAVCFDCPTAELLADGDLARSRSLRSLGPDLLAERLDLDAAVDRLAAVPGRTVGEALLDQRVVAGIGNVVRNEALFMERVNPWTPAGELDVAVQRCLIETAAGILQASAASGRRVTTGDRRRGAALWVYRRAGRPCRRCGTLIQAARQGTGARTAYWCPSCQPGT